MRHSLVMILLLPGCAPMPRDRLGDDRVIEHLTPLVTTVAPRAAAPGARVRVTAYLSNPELEETLMTQVLLCPNRNEQARDIQCLSGDSALVLVEEVPAMSEELVTYAFDYDVPADLPDGFTERVLIRTQGTSRIVMQTADISVTQQPTQSLPQPSARPQLERGGKYFALDETAVTRVTPGEYALMMAPNVSFFCTPGCSSVTRMGPSTAPKIRLEPGAPKLYLFSAQALARYVISVAE